MSGNEPSEAEIDGLEAICGAEDVTAHERLKSSGEKGAKTPDWRVRLADGRVAYVEVTTDIDGEERSLFAALSDDGMAKKWPDRRLAHKWTLFVADRSPRGSKRNSMKDLVAALRNRLAFVEALGGTPAQMSNEAERQLIGPDTYLNRLGGWRSYGDAHRHGVSFEDWCAKGTDYWYPQLLMDYYRDSQFTQSVSVMGEPEMLGAGKGLVETVACVTEGGADYDSVAPAIQRAVDRKTANGQLENAQGLKWLVVMLDGIPGFQLGDAFGPRSPVPHPMLEGISFSSIDDVWAVAREAESFVVLRISDGGTRQQPHVVSRSETAVSG